MQMYEGLPIITNKMALQDRQGVPHHFLGMVPRDQEIRIGQWESGVRSLVSLCFFFFSFSFSCTSFFLFLLHKGRKGHKQSSWVPILITKPGERGAWLPVSM